MFYRVFIFIVASVCCSAQANQLEFRLLSEVYDPVQYIENNQLVGPNVEFLRKVFATANIPMPEVEVFHWARSYNIALTEKNALIFGMVKTPSREPHFIWVGPIAKSTFYLYGLNDRQDIQLNSLEDAKRYLIGVVKDDVSYQYLTNNGFSEGENLLLMSSFAKIQHLFFEGKVDMLVSSPLTIEKLASKHNLDNGAYRKLLPISGLDVTFYLAANINTDKALITTLQRHWPNTINQY